MARKMLAGLASAAMIVLSAACQVVTETPPATTTPAPPTRTPSPTVNFEATERSFERQIQLTEDVLIETITQEAFSRATRQTATVQTRTQEAQIQATQQATDLFQTIQTLHSEGLLDDPGGTYHRIGDFDESWAQIDWYQWWPTGYAPENFVVRAHTIWESGSPTANWFSSGCGFVFREKDADNHYLIYLALDGNVYLKGYVSGKFFELGREYYGKVETLQGEADVMLVASGDRIAYFVNGERVFERSNSALNEAGDLAITLVSGTNKTFGTRCMVTEIELWELEEQAGET